MPTLRGIGAGSAWVLVGPTASGKSAVAEWIAREEGLDLLSADSMQVYRGMDIGTAKPTAAERRLVKYFGIDLVSPAESYSSGDYVRYARQVLRDQAASARSTLVVGGTGLYVKGLTQGLHRSPGSDPTRRQHWQKVHEHGGITALKQALETLAPGWLEQLEDPRNPRRLIRALEQAETGRSGPGPEWNAHPPPKVVGLRIPPPVLAARIAERVERMFKQGLEEEVRQLRHDCPEWSKTAAQAIGYAEVLELLEGKRTREEAVDRIVIRTRQFAKRQRTWFRHQANVEWIDIEGAFDTAATARRVVDAMRRCGPTRVIV